MFDRLEVKFAWNRLGGSYSGLGGGFAIGTDVYLFYKKLQELARQSEIERQKVLEEKKKQTKKWFEEYFQYIPCKDVEGKKVLEITKKDFQKLLDNKEDFSEHCFRLFDSDDSGDVSIPEIQAGLNKLSMTGEAHKKTIKWFVSRLEKYTNGGDVTRESFSKSINPTFLSKLFDLLDIDGGGTLTLEEFKRSVDRLLMMGSDEKILAYLENMFHENALDTENITYDEFKRVIFNKQEYFTKKMFSICDRDNSQSISLQEFTETLGKLMKQSDNEEEINKINRDKLHFLFRIYDNDDSGEIDREEMRECIEICTKESNLDIADVEVLADTLFDKADADKSGEISFDEFYNILKPFINNLEINPKGWVLPEKKKTYRKQFKEFKDKYFAPKYLRNNVVVISNIIVLVILYIAVFTTGIIFYKDTYVALMIAKGAGKCLNLTTCLLFVSMLRFCLTTIRETPLGKILALDLIVDAHKVLGVIYAVFAFIHSVAHIFTFLKNSELNTVKEDDGSEKVDYSFVLKVGGYFGGSYMSGILLDVILCIMLPFAHSCVRRSGNFSHFFWVHFASYWLLAIGTILHCQNAWKWLCVPLAIYIIEKIANSNLIKQHVIYRDKFNIINYKVLPSNVIELHLNRPSTFNFNSGSYAFITIPHITSYEKHPFTISSSAEDKSKLTFHIKKEQGWTKKLYEILVQDLECKKRNEKLQKENGDNNGQLAIEVSSNAAYMERDPMKYKHLSNFGMLAKKQLVAYIDGPYGTPATEIFESQHAVLVAAGIGVTPFSSILQTIVHRYNRAGCFCEGCGHWNDHGTFKSEIKVQKLDFVWITRDQKSLQWFLELLKNIEETMDRFCAHGHTKDEINGKKSPKNRENKNGIELKEIDPEIEKNSENGTNGTNAEEKTESNRFLDIHIYLTSALSKKDFRAVGLQYALQLMREGNPEGQDHITGLKAQTNTGRPDWDELFEKIAPTQQDPRKRRKVTVFFCGSPMIEEALKVQCTKREFKFRAEKF